MTQNEKVLDYIQQYGGITQLEALRDLGILRLASRVSDLRKLGNDIGREMIAVRNREGGTTKVARYYMN